MFGELIGLAVAQCWIDQGQPENAWLVELGPGRGTLMSDMLRALSKVPNARESLRPCLLEASPRLRDVQAENLAEYSPTWASSIDDVPAGSVFVVANEFFDALPIRQFERGQRGWHERHVGMKDGVLVLGRSPESDVPALRKRTEDTTLGQVVEICESAIATAEWISTRIADDGGAALFIDYGDWHSLGDTLQALRDHKPVDPLDTPGQADLTAHVDFEPIAATAASIGLEVSPLTPQGVFLERLGITQRAQSLAQHLSGHALDQHVQAHRRLTHPEEMGTLFKCLALTTRGTGPFPGMAG
jgi:SAM-dependent MidA family methyltransferase